MIRRQLFGPNTPRLWIAHAQANRSHEQQRAGRFSHHPERDRWDHASRLRKAELVRQEYREHPDPSRSRARCGQGPAARLEARAQVKLLELAAKELGDDSLGFHLAQSFDVRQIGLVYYVMASSERLSDALRNAERYSRIVNEGVRLSVSFDKGGAAVALDYVDFDRRLDQHHTEFWLVTLVRICREIAGSRFAPRQLKVRHARATQPAAFRSFFGVEVQFGCDVDEIVLSAPVASLPAARRDTHLNSLLRRYADEALASQPAKRVSVRLAVERLLPELLPHGKANAMEVARRLGTSSRSLSRKLQKEGTTFAKILDELRSALAKIYLAERELSISRSHG